ncbi:hypothetical protein AOLI_G00111170 [Acnodon oligacanthus]
MSGPKGIHEEFLRCLDGSRLHSQKKSVACNQAGKTPPVHEDSGEVLLPVKDFPLRPTLEHNRIMRPVMSQLSNIWN